mgnify:FL=1
MQIVDLIVANGHWSWIVGGLVLLGLELVLPGGFLLWMGISGIITGLLTMVQPMPWPLQWLIFGGLSLLTIFAWVRWSRNRPTPTDRPFLNRRADHFIGHETVLEQAIAQGYGRGVLGDTVWRVSGPELPVGQRVRIVGSDGAVLKVEAIS